MNFSFGGRLNLIISFWFQNDVCDLSTPCLKKRPTFGLL